VREERRGGSGVAAAAVVVVGVEVAAVVVMAVAVVAMAVAAAAIWGDTSRAVLEDTDGMAVGAVVEVEVPSGCGGTSGLRDDERRSAVG